MIIIYKEWRMFRKTALALKKRADHKLNTQTKKACDLIEVVVGVLRQQDDLSPNNQLVTEHLTKLVETLQDSVANGYSDQLISDLTLLDKASELSALCGSAECEMEKFWAKEFISHADKLGKPLQKGDLKKFWYQAEYESLCRAEWDIISSCNLKDEINQICFMGSGALPLTAILAAYDSPNLKIKCVDFDKEACELSKQLIEALGLSNQIEVINQAALDYQPSKKELIICASLLVNKAGVYEDLLQKGADYMMVRDAEGVYQFLYEPAQKPSKDFEKLAQTTKTDTHINTSILYRIKRKL